MKKIIAVGLSICFLMLVFAGCIEDSKDYTTPIGKNIGDTTYSEDGKTAMVYISSYQKGNTTVIVNTIAKMYDDGFTYTCIIPIPDTSSGRNAYYLVFRK